VSCVPKILSSHLIITTILENNEKQLKIIDLATIANDYNKSNLETFYIINESSFGV
jgi:hypothetical protein